ncbi:MAG: hypothetical protein WBM77_05740, partial [Maribacter sp.]
LSVLGNDQEQETRREALQRVRKQLALNPTDKRALSLGAGSLFDNGENEEAIVWIKKALELYPEDPGILFNAVCLFAKIGNKDKALSLMELALEKGSGNKEWIERDPDYDSLRNEPHFKAMMKTLK